MKRRKNLSERKTNWRKKPKNEEPNCKKYEKRVLSKEESVDRKSDALERREAEYANKEEQLRKKRKESRRITCTGVQELERISGLTSEQAKDYLLKAVEDEVKIDRPSSIRNLRAKPKEEANRKAKGLRGDSDSEMCC